MTAPVRVVEDLVVTGVVQGVGFRPFVYRLAHDLGLDGHVGNDATSVFVRAAGPPRALDELARRLATDAPALARVDAVERRTAAADVTAGFHIVASREAASGERTIVPPDTAVCDECVAELLDPRDRRHRHPFVTCTNCGPRATIVTALPYDRPNTTMAGFPMCAACAAEYADPADRRYHAQPIACHDCGPRLRFADGAGAAAAGDDALAATVGALRAGMTVAVKGIGGFHLACDAASDAAVRRLRERKRRPDKPFAVMVRDLDAARRLAHVDDAEARLLASPARPIVLLRARAANGLSALVAPGNPLVGVLLAYAPVHHLLFADGAGPLVMTSANPSGLPIAYRDADEPAVAALADALLTHDRPIHVPIDDSVVRVVDGGLLPVRRARGYAPLPVPLAPSDRAVLAVGGELKNTACLVGAAHAWVSPHVGTMGTVETLAAFERTVGHLAHLYDVVPDVVAVDAHPGYATSGWARRTHPGRVVEVQHHHAHVAAVMAEHGLDPATQVLGIAFDGTGYGTDGAIWGGEALLADAAGFARVAHLAYVPLPGGDAAVRNPCRVALAHLHAAGVGWDDDLPPVGALDAVERGLLARQLATGFACVPTSSMGRLFDAVASLLGLRHRISYEAQAAIDLELAAHRSARRDLGLRFAVGDHTFDAAPVIRALVDERRRGTAGDDLAFAFHVAVAELVTELATRARLARADLPLALTGGVFQNALLVELTLARLRGAGVDALTHRTVPPNDGALALGQAYVARYRPSSTDKEP